MEGAKILFDFVKIPINSPIFNDIRSPKGHIIRVKTGYKMALLNRSD